MHHLLAWCTGLWSSQAGCSMALQPTHLEPRESVQLAPRQSWVELAEEGQDHTCKESRQPQLENI